MAGETVITVIGNLTADPELRFTPSGAAVANFTVASTPRTFDRQSQEWKDGEALFLRCNVWRQVAENVAESLTRGSRVIVSGRLKQRSFDTKEGEKRTVIELEVDEIGPSLRYATAKVTSASRGEGGGGFGGGGGGGGGFGSSGGGGGGWRRERPLVDARRSVRRTALLRKDTLAPHASLRSARALREGRSIPSLLIYLENSGAQAPCSQAQEEGLPVLQGQGDLRRLQGHDPAAEVHLRPRQDPCPPRQRQLQPAPAGRRDGREEQP